MGKEKDRKGGTQERGGKGGGKNESLMGPAFVTGVTGRTLCTFPPVC